MILLHIIYSAIVLSIQPLAEFETDHANPVLRTLGFEPPCLAAGLASFADRVIRRFDISTVQWPVTYADDCLDSISALEIEDEDDSMVITSTIVYPTKAPVALNIVLEGTATTTHKTISVTDRLLIAEAALFFILIACFESTCRYRNSNKQVIRTPFGNYDLQLVSTAPAYHASGPVICSLRDTVLRLRTLLQYFISKLANLNIENADLEQMLLRSMLELDNKHDQIGVLNWWGAQSCHSITNLFARLFRLRTRFAAARALIVNNPLRIILLSFRNTYLEGENERLKSYIARLEYGIRQADARVDELEVRAEFESRKNESSNKELKDHLEYSIMSKNSEIKSLNQWKSQLTTKNRNQEASITQLQTDKANLESTNSNLQAAVFELKRRSEASVEDPKTVPGLKKDNRILMYQMSPVMRLLSLLGVTTSMDVLGSASPTVYIFKDPARKDGWLSTRAGPSEYAKGSSQKRNTLRSILVKGSSRSLKIDKATGHRLPDL